MTRSIVAQHGTIRSTHAEYGTAGSFTESRTTAAAAAVERRFLGKAAAPFIVLVGIHVFILGHATTVCMIAIVAQQTTDATGQELTRTRAHVF